MTYKPIRYRLYPNDAQRDMLMRHFGSTRWVYNRYISEAERLYFELGQYIKRDEFIVDLARLKKTEFPWLAEVNSQSLQMAARNAATAYERFFKGLAKHPKFKSKHSKQSFQCPQHVKVLFNESSSKYGRIVLPKIGSVKAKLHRRFEDERIKTVTITIEPSGKFYASVLLDDGKPKPQTDVITKERTAGIDAGIKKALVVYYPDSTTQYFANPHVLEKQLQAIQKLNKILSRRHVEVSVEKDENGKGRKIRHESRGYQRVKQRLALVHEKVRHIRQDYAHQITHRLANESQVTTYVVEDLNLKGMVKNHKLARALADVGIGQLYNFLAYKLEACGKNLIYADRFFPSSKRCSACGRIHQGLTLKDREWTCVCGQHHERDENAAINLTQYPFLEENSREGRDDPKSVKSSPRVKDVGASALAKEVLQVEVLGSLEASAFRQR